VATSQWANGTCPHHALIIPVRVGGQKMGSRSGLAKAAIKSREDALMDCSGTQSGGIFADFPYYYGKRGTMPLHIARPTAQFGIARSAAGRFADLLRRKPL
jgi:hypothetical protein